MIKRRYLFALAILALVLAGGIAPASARTESISHGGSFFGNNVVVEPDQEIQGNITVYGGDARIEGKVDGDVTSYGGSVEAVDGGTITGNANAYGGDVSTSDGGSISGSTNEYGSSWGSWLPFGVNHTVASENRHLMTRLTYSVIVVLAFLIFPIRVRKALDRIEHHPGLSAATGVLALIAVIPIALILFVSVVGWPLIPVEFVAIFAGFLIGQAALGVLVGRRIFELVQPHGTPSPLAALIVGLVVICAAEILPAVGGLVTALVCLVGLGAAILAFIRESTFGGPGFPGATAPAGPGTRPTISGPPMSQV